MSDLSKIVARHRGDGSGYGDGYGDGYGAGCGCGIVCVDVDAAFTLQRCAGISRRFTDADLARRYTLAQQARDQGARHAAAADERDGRGFDRLHQMHSSQAWRWHAGRIERSRS